jgi:hypothetical protein
MLVSTELGKYHLDHQMMVDKIEWSLKREERITYLVENHDGMIAHGIHT